MSETPAEYKAAPEPVHVAPARRSIHEISGIICQIAERTEALMDAPDLPEAERAAAYQEMLAALADNAEDAKTRFRNWLLWRRDELAQAGAIEQEAAFLNSRADAITNRVKAVDGLYADALWQMEGHKIKIDLGGISVGESRGALVIDAEHLIPDDPQFWVPMPPKPATVAIREAVEAGTFPRGAAHIEKKRVLHFPREPKP